METLSLSKNQTLSLRKTVPTLKKARFCLGWKGVPEYSTPDGRRSEKPAAPKPQGLLSKLIFGAKPIQAEAPEPEFVPQIIGYRDVDLDASVAMLDVNKAVIGTVSFSNLISSNGAIRHSGDDLTGRNDRGLADNEIITVDLDTLPANVQTLVFTVNSFRGHTFDTVSESYIRVVDSATDREIGRYEFTGKDRSTGVVMCSLKRNNGDWDFKAIGEFASGNTIQSIIGSVIRYA